MNRRNFFLATIALGIIVSFQPLIARAQGPAIGDRIVGVSLPNPKLVFTGKEHYQANGQKWVRYNLSVTNYSAYPNSLFAPAPQLAPCGANTSASRTWIDINEQPGGQRIYGFCAFGQAQDLTKLWFAVKKGEDPPSCVSITMTDRKLNKVYKSNKVCFASTPSGPGDFTIGEPDLKIEGFWFVQDIKTVRVLVQNAGAANSKPCILRLTVRKIDGVSVGRVTELPIPAIPAGHHLSFFIHTNQILPNNVALKDTTFKLQVDVTGLVNESDESNNQVWHNL